MKKTFLKILIAVFVVELATTQAYAADFYRDVGVTILPASDATLIAVNTPNPESVNYTLFSVINVDVKADIAANINTDYAAINNVNAIPARFRNATTLTNNTNEKEGSSDSATRTGLELRGFEQLKTCTSDFIMSATSTGETAVMFAKSEVGGWLPGETVINNNRNNRNNSIPATGADNATIKRSVINA